MIDTQLYALLRESTGDATLLATYATPNGTADSSERWEITLSVRRQRHHGEVI